MKKRKIVMSVLIVTMLASCMACGNIKDHKDETLKNSVTEKVTVSNTEVAEDTENIEPVDIKIDDLKPLADAGVITGVEDIIVPESTDVNLNKRVYADKNIVKSVDIDDSAVDYSKAGTYEVIYTITFDGEKLRDYVKENNINVNFDTNDKTIVVKTKVTITVATEEDTEKAIESGNTNVVTPETEKSVAESNKAKANDNAVASKPAEKPAGNTEKPHVHKYNSGVVTKEPTCTDTGVKTYTCVDGDYSYDEKIPALGHNPVQRTETVTTKEAWDEPVLEPRYICNGCGEQFTNTTDVCRHLILANRENPDTPCGNYHEEDVQVNTIHHPAETETRTYNVCSRCGERLP